MRLQAYKHSSCWISRLVVGALLAIFVLIGPKADKLGDHFQVALPLLALGCSIANGDGPEYLLRYTVMFTGLHGTKSALGEAPYNMRPNGSTRGMPSGHTATAVFGASTLLHECAMKSAPARVAVIAAAAFTGASRMDAGAHTIWQVFFGALWGLICDRALRFNTNLRHRARMSLRYSGRRIGLTFRKITCSAKPGPFLSFLFSRFS